jgi:DNA ligase (NAD+)
LTLDSDPERELESLGAEEARRQAEALKAELHRHGYLYYVEARPAVSDEEYDRLYRRLQALEEAYPELLTPDSPTQRVGAEPQDKFETVAHAAPMLSLDSTQSADEIGRFDDRIRKALGDIEPTYLLEPKLDGASIELVYESGVFVRAVTRGNGQEGENVTENIRTVRTVPLRLRNEDRPAPDLLALRGEVMMYISDFEAFNEGLVAGGQEPYASPRNSAAGSVRQLDSRITASRKLDVLVYDILRVDGASFSTDAEGVEAIRQWGFRVPERVQVARSVEDIIAYHGAFASDRDHRREGGAGHDLPPSAVGSCVQVRASPGGHAHREDRSSGGSHRRADARGLPAPRVGRRCDDRPRVLAQPGRAPSEGHSGG